jgi:hypothetical protein
LLFLRRSLLLVVLLLLVVRVVVLLHEHGLFDINQSLNQTQHQLALIVCCTGAPGRHGYQGCGAEAGT